MKIYAVSFPSDTPVLRRLVGLGREEILLSYFFLRDGDPLVTIVEKIYEESST